MIIQRLKEYAERNGLVGDPAFEKQKVKWLIVLRDDGSYLSIERTVGAQPQGKGKEPRGKEYLVPNVGVRRQGVPRFLVDELDGVLGLGTKQSTPKKHSNFVELVRQAARESNDAGLKAVARYYNRQEAREAILRRLAELGVKDDSGDIFSFALQSDGPLAVFERPAVKAYARAWAAKRADEQMGRQVEVCLCCGQIGKIARVHHPVKALPGIGGPTRTLVSYNEDAYKSLGLEKAYNGPICRSCARAYVAGLNHLLASETNRFLVATDRPRQKRGAGGKPRESVPIVFCWWTRRGGETEFDLNAMLNEARPEEVKRLLESLYRGSGGGTVKPDEFYALTLSGDTESRITVRDWIESTVGHIKQNVGQWFKDLEVVASNGRGMAPPPRFHELCWALVAKSKKVPNHVVASLFRAAISGGPLPLSVAPAVLRRLRAGGGTDIRDGKSRGKGKRLPKRPRDVDRVSCHHAALLRGVLNRNWKGRQEMARCLDKERTNPGYLLGRLLSLIDSIQYHAVGEVNRTLVDAYYSGASTMPSAVFPIILKCTQKHLAKMRRSKRGPAVRLGKDLQSVYCLLDRIPKVLALPEQAEFALGFYHQQAERYGTKKPYADNQAQSEENEDRE